MPTNEQIYRRYDGSARWNRARAEVRAKFPGLIEGSSSWDRAVRNRYNRSRI
jgi:hypothetical protein